MAFRATLNFQKFKVALNAPAEFFKLCPELRVFLPGHNVAMVTYYVMKRATTCSPIVGQLFDTMIVASSDKEWLQEPI